MNKQELISKLKEKYAVSKQKTNGELNAWNYAETITFRVAIELAEQLDEASQEECEIKQVSENESECSNCSHTINHYTFTFNEEYEIPADGYEFYQVNYCPNCGAKIKRGEEWWKYM